ncbi:MAG: aldehyde dehydrogenase family protein [Planctomycetes bacterium]|nr:aldehyde dehydrogenase family protein [Planctomycetota bacterium]MBL7007869.1 aldehyde dehydrogenase family protein [Planctomycetota bacterium]
MSRQAANQEKFSPQPEAEYPPAAHFIAGDWSEPASGGRLASIDPSNEEAHGEIAAGNAEDVDRAVRAASAAFEDSNWRHMAPSKRARILGRLAELVDQNRANLALLESLDTGKTAFDSGKIEIPMVAEILRYYAGWVTKLEGAVVPLPGNAMGLSLREPVGVCGLITPWNFPLLLATWKVAPALACGNTVVLKPSELTSMTSLWLAKLGAEAGLPPGVLNVVTGDGEAVGMPLVRHPRVDKISFTGSTRVGKLVQRESAETLKRVTLELGGKSPNIVFADADLKAATRGVIGGIFYNKGEVCAAGSRVLVQREVYDDFLAGLKAAAEKTTVGHPLAAGTRMGPVCNARQFDSVRRFIQGGLEDGARLVAGGRDLRDEVGGGKGYYIEPTVFADVDPKARIAQEEIFGPVLSVMPFDTPEQALEIAHDTRYGLAAGVWTRDIGRGLSFARALRAGTVWVNAYNLYDPGLSFGGFGDSGFGRDLGRAALDSYTEPKSVWLNLD